MWGRIPVAAGVAALAFALPGAARADAPAYVGAATHPLSLDKPGQIGPDLDLLQSAGANSVRIDMGWSSLEFEKKGVYSPANADAFFAEARKRNLKVIVTFLGSPCWASSAPDDKKLGTDGKVCGKEWYLNQNNVDLYPPKKPVDFADAAAYVAKRWGADIAALEVWNEPDYRYYFNTATPVADYAALLAATYPKVKAAAPNVPVLGGALLGNNQPFLDALYAAGIQPFTDGISVHPYAIAAPPRDTGDVPAGVKYQFLKGVPITRRSMVANGDAGKKLWITEMGWSSCKAEGSVSEWCVTQDQQAQNIGDAFRVVRDCWDYVAALSIYTLRNTGPELNRREPQMGMLYPDGTPKASFAAFGSALTDLKANPGLGAPGAGTLACQAPPPAQTASAPPSPPGPVRTFSLPVVPKVSGLSLRPSKIRRGKRTRVSWRLNEAARVTFSVERLGAKRRWVRVRGSFARSGRAGTGSLTFAGTLGKRRLAVGRYRLTAVAKNRSGRKSKPARAAFRIVPG